MNRKQFWLASLLSFLLVSASTACAHRSRASGSIIRNSPELSPIWSRGMVWYQVFPERFANGDPENDPIGAGFSLVDWDQDFGEPTIEEIERSWFLTQGEPERHRYDPNRSGGQSRT